MKKYTFKKINTNDSKKNFVDSILGKGQNTDYSKILDNIILSNVIKKNDYLFENIPSIASKTDLDDFLEAAEFLANYKKPETERKYIFGRTYYLADGTPIIFYNDEIQIGFDCYKYSDFGSIDFISTIKPDVKQTIIDIYTHNSDVTININL